MRNGSTRFLASWEARDGVDAREKLRAALESLAASFRGQAPLCPGFPYASLEEVVLDHGDYFQPRALPRHYEYDPIGTCFASAARSALTTPGLHYVEGFALCRTLPVLGHAWCIDAQGHVVDTTWRWGDRDGRFGAGLS